MYELTMLRGALASGAASRHSVFELFGCRPPRSRRFGAVVGTGRLLDAIEASTLTPTQTDLLHRTGIVNGETLDFLRGYRFPGTTCGYAEGGCYLAGSPLLTVEGTFAEACILETLILSIYNYSCTVAAAASRVTIAAHGRPCMDFGVCRAHEQATIAAARTSVVDGFVGTNNLEAGPLYGIPTVGISAHSLTFLHDAEEETSAAQVADLGPNTMILVDTYDITTGMERAIKAACAMGGEPEAMRLDFSSLVTEAFKMRARLDTLGATSMRITVTNGPDGHAIATLGAAPVNSYGVGTKLVTGSGHPTAVLVCKLVEREGANGTMEGVTKFSPSGESTVGDRKWTGRILSSEDTTAEGLVVAFSSQDEGVSALNQAGTRPLRVLLVDEGQIIEEYCGKRVLSITAEWRRASRVELPYDAWHLSDGESTLPTHHIDPDGRGATRR